MLLALKMFLIGLISLTLIMSIYFLIDIIKDVKNCKGKYKIEAIFLFVLYLFLISLIIGLLILIWNLDIFLI